MKTGIVKVIPPPEWVAKQPALDDAIKNVHIKNPIMQEIAGSGGTYRQANMEKGRSYNLPQWRHLCEQSEHQPPAKRGERRNNQDPAAKTSGRTKASASKAAGPKRKSGRVAKGKENENSDRLPTPVSPKDDDDESVQMEDDAPAPKRRNLGGGRGGRGGGRGGGQSKATSVSARRMNNQAQTAFVDEAAFENFKYELDELFPPERCAELEKHYWKGLTYSSPLYGGDMPGTLFDDRTKEWNLSDLPNLLNVLGQKIPGVNTAYLYLGMWKATFAWHLEDVDLYSINYLHFGAPKQWYSISQADARKFEKVMGSIWPIDSKKCDQFLRHKTYLISPHTLKTQHGITANQIVHHPGEFIITFPYGYHSGYNLGYNCAEAVNFAVESWLEHAKIAKRCECTDAEDSVWVDHREIERKLRGEDWDEETDEEDEEDDEDDAEIENSGLPSPPNGTGDLKLKIVRKKQKRTINDKSNKATTKKIRIRVKAPMFEPCILCPNNIPSEPLLETEDGQKVHRKCAQYIPETRIESGDKDIVLDLEHIPQARHDLKCNFCRSKKGACFQCSQKKCTRAYHATCAAAAGVFVEEGEVPHFGEDGTEYKKSDFGFSCRFHRAKRDKKLDANELADDDRILKAASALKVGEICQLQFYRKDIFAGAIVENRRGEETLLVDVVPRGYVFPSTSPFENLKLTNRSERIEVEYKWLLLPDKSDYSLPKASANAIAMPKSFKDRAKLKTTERQANDAPRMYDPFVTGTTWQEFQCNPIARNMDQVRVDMFKYNQVWYYLGRNSTEAKPQYTHDPAIRVHNVASTFLDTTAPATRVPRPFSYAASYPTSAPNRSVMRPPPPTYASNTVSASTSAAAGTLMKPEKPYMYKPRLQGPEPYTHTQVPYAVDPQAYRSQLNFVQRSAQTPILPPAKPSLNFNSDPKFQAAARSSNVYPNNNSSQAPHTAARPVTAYSNNALNQGQTTANRPAIAYTNAGSNYASASPRLPNAYSNSASNQTSPASNRPAHVYPHQTSAGVARPAPAYPVTGMYQASQTVARQTNGFPNLGSNQAPSNTVRQQTVYPSKPPSHVSTLGPLAPPASYRPPQLSATMPQAAPGSQGTPRVKKAAKEVRTSIFVKYPYLQKEHNRDAGEYKTPYRPGGGFMNGYEGSMKGFEEAARLKIFGPSTGRKPETRILPPMKYMSNPQSRTSTTSPPNQAHNPKAAPVYSSMPTPSASPTVSNASSVQVQSTWPKKDRTSFHPAIRDQYKTSHQNSCQYPTTAVQPSPMYYSQSPQQSQSPGIHAPPPDPQGYITLHTGNGRAALQAPQQHLQNGSPVQSHMQNSPANVYRPSSQSASPAQAYTQAASPTSYPQASQNGQRAPDNGPQQFSSPSMYNYPPQYSGGTQHSRSNYQPGSAYQAGPSPQQSSYHQHGMPAQNMVHKQYSPPMSHEQARGHQARPEATQQAVSQAPPRMSNELQQASKQQNQTWNTNAQSLTSIPGQPCDLIDLPADSSSLIEKVMMNLRKA